MAQQETLQLSWRYLVARDLDELLDAIDDVEPSLGADVDLVARVHESVRVPRLVRRLLVPKVPERVRRRASPELPHLAKPKRLALGRDHLGFDHRREHAGRGAGKEATVHDENRDDCARLRH